MTSGILFTSQWWEVVIITEEDSSIEVSGYFDLATDFCQKFQLFRKVLQTKVVLN